MTQKPGLTVLMDDSTGPFSFDTLGEIQQFQELMDKVRDKGSDDENTYFVFNTTDEFEDFLDKMREACSDYSVTLVLHDDGVLELNIE